MSLTIKVKNCLQPPGRVPRFEAQIADSVLFWDDKGRLAEGIIRTISQDGGSISVLLASGEEATSISVTSIVAIMLC